ncbi:MAG: hypothetical protein F6K24_18680 [Okeania sp. SIO2D1]|nr:hypothetical protein [Okeania sp. SIO2D1]
MNFYPQTFPEPGEKIEEEIEAIDLDYLIEDLPNTIDSMKAGIDRVTEISKSMRTFSGGDSAAKISFNLYDEIMHDINPYPTIVLSCLSPREVGQKL